MAVRSMGLLSFFKRDHGMKSFLLCLCFVLLTAPSFAGDFTKGFSRHQVNLGFSGFSIKEDTLLSRGMATTVEGDFLYGVEDDLQLHLTPVASFVSGQQTSRDPLSPLTNSLYLKEASVEKKLGYELSFKAGALYQKDFLPAIAGHVKAFPGVAVMAPVSLGNHLVEVRAQAAVPASSGLASSSTELTSSASLYSGTAFFNSRWSDSFSTVFSLSHFGFDKLSSSAASESIYRGNTVASPNTSTKIFVYKYQGNEVALSADYKGEMFVFRFLSSFIKNDSAPKKQNQGYFFSVSPGFVLPSKSLIQPVFEHYHVEADAMVASYSDTTYGRTNRDGYRYGVNYESRHYRLSFIYAYSKLIQSTAFQSADKTYFMNLNLDNLF